MAARAMMPGPGPVVAVVAPMATVDRPEVAARPAVRIPQPVVEGTRMIHAPSVVARPAEVHRIPVESMHGAVPGRRVVDRPVDGDRGGIPVPGGCPGIAVDANL